MNQAEDRQGALDVAIVGGGVSGAYTAWRLKAHDPGLKLALYEASDRIGGRLLSVRPPADLPLCELGGMRYMTSQPYVTGLVERVLKLETFLQVGTEPWTVDRPENLLRLRGRTFKRRDLLNPGVPPYILDWAEQGMDPGELVTRIVKRLIPGLEEALDEAAQGADGASKVEQVLRQARIGGVRLHRLGFWDILLKAMGSEAYHMARNTLGYDSLASNANAVDLIFEFMDFAPNVQYRRLKAGFEAVPRALADRFKAAGGSVHLGHSLRSVEKEPSGRDKAFLLNFEHGGRKALVRARSVILAMPRRSLELLERKGPLFDPGDPKARQVRALLETVRPIPLFKLFLCYPSSWWKTLGLTCGRSVTDLPLRQIYYWATNSAATPSTSVGKPDGILMAYNDAENVDFWSGMRRKPSPAYRKIFGAVPSYKRPHPLHGEELQLPESWQRHLAPERMVEEVHRQICEMHGVRAVSSPYSAAYRDWSEEPFGAGVHFWKIGVKSWELVHSIIQPRPGLPVYIVGEAYSDRQSWVEGALRTSEMVLQEKFRVAPPPWVEGGAL